MTIGHRLDALTKKLKGFVAVLALLSFSFQAFGLPVIAQSVVISEFMPDPVIVSDMDGEWIELRNISSEPQDITGWKLNDGTSHTLSSANLVVLGSDLTLDPYEYFLICKNSDTAVNGGLNCDYKFSGMSLSNSSTDSVTLESADSSTSDTIDYNQPDPLNPSELEIDVEAGKSIIVERDSDGEPVIKTDPNAGGTPGSVNFDNTAPVHNLTTPLDTTTVGASFNVEGSAFDGGSGLKQALLLIDGNPVSPYDPVELEGFNDDYKFTNISLSEGSHKLNVAVEDHAGNTAGLSEPIDIIVDATAPVVAVNSQETNSRSPQISGTVDDPSADVEVTVDGNTYSAVNSGAGSWSLAENTIAPLLADGTYDITVTATDEYGNSSNDNTNSELFIDATAPAITVDKKKTSDRSPELTGTIDDNKASILITVNGNTYTATNHGDGTWSLSDQELVSTGTTGKFDVKAEATDDLGNIGYDETTNELEIVSIVQATTDKVKTVLANVVSAASTSGDGSKLDSDGDGIPNSEDSTPYGETEDTKNDSDKDDKQDKDSEVASDNDANNNNWRWFIFALAVGAFLWFMLRGKAGEES